MEGNKQSKFLFTIEDVWIAYLHLKMFYSYYKLCMQYQAPLAREKNNIIMYFQMWEKLMIMLI